MCAQVEYCDDLITELIAAGYLAESDQDNRQLVGHAITRLLDAMLKADFPHHP